MVSEERSASLRQTGALDDSENQFGLQRGLRNRGCIRHTECICIVCKQFIGDEFARSIPWPQTRNPRLADARLGSSLSFPEIRALGGTCGGVVAEIQVGQLSPAFLRYADE